MWQENHPEIWCGIRTQQEICAFSGRGHTKPAQIFWLSALPRSSSAILDVFLARIVMETSNSSYEAPARDLVDNFHDPLQNCSVISSAFHTQIVGVEALVHGPPTRLPGAQSHLDLILASTQRRFSTPLRFVPLLSQNWRGSVGFLERTRLSCAGGRFAYLFMCCKIKFSPLE